MRQKRHKRQLYRRTANLLHIRWRLVVFDFLIFAILSLFGLLFRSTHPTGWDLLFIGVQTAAAGIFLFCGRLAFGVYRQIWRYGNANTYLRLILADVAAGVVYFALQELFFPAETSRVLTVAMFSLDLLGALSARILYHCLYQYCSFNGEKGKFLRRLTLLLTGVAIEPGARVDGRRIKLGIVGAGRVGAALAEELRNDPSSPYVPCCFIEISRDKIGRQICGIPVFREDADLHDTLIHAGVQEIVFAIPHGTPAEKKALYERYKSMGYEVRVYDYPVFRADEGGRRHMREFSVEELLFRQEIEFSDHKTTAYYQDRVVLITGGGGSIGSELGRQVAAMSPKQIVLLDIYENGVYNLQQELKAIYRDKLDVKVEIASVCDRREMDRIFSLYRPNIVLHAAAHKHVPLMEHNACEAIRNNVFGTLNVIESARAHGVSQFILLSTDKAVNPTNVMGATKRMCEMILLCYSRISPNMVVSATRFGNVLGSAGSVIPLFKAQIARGGPVTITDKRIIRYFMTIPEASQLVLQTGAMGKNGTLFVLDMGNPIRILDLAENMIRLSGFEPYRDIDILETGLRPGEKLYEEMLMRDGNLGKTENGRIYTETDVPIEPAELKKMLDHLRQAAESGNNDQACAALRDAVSTFRDPDEVNSVANRSEEMLLAGRSRGSGYTANCTTA